MQSTVECPVCVDFYVPRTRVPKTLPCGHGVCEPCVQSLLSAASGPAISCPTCRATCTIPDKQADKLPTTFPILQLLESLCGDCRDRPHTQRCGHCPLNVCDVCKETHQRDLTTDLTDDIRELKQVMADLNSMLPGDKEFESIHERGDHTIEKITENYNEEKRQLEEKYHKNMAAVKAETQQSINGLLEWTDKSRKILFECESFLVKQRYQKQQQSSGGKQLGHEKSKQVLKHKVEALLQMKDCKPNEVDKLSTNLDHFMKITSSRPTISLLETQTRAAVIISTPVPDYSAASFKAMFDQQLSWPIGICTDPTTGHIIATDYDQHEVIVLTADLQLVSRFGAEGQGANQYKHPWGVAVSDGQLCVCDQCNHRIHVTDLRGVDLCVFGSGVQGREDFDNPSGLSCDSAGLLYICDSCNKRIKVTDRRGAFVREFGRDVFGGEPYFNAVSADGRVAVITHTGNNIYLFTISGQHITTISTNSPSHKIAARGVAFDDHGHLLVTDGAGGRVAVMTETGDVVCFIGTPGAGPGQLKDPHGLAVTRDGDVVVCDRRNKRIQLFKVPKKN